MHSGLGERRRNGAADGGAAVVLGSCESEKCGGRPFLSYFLLLDDIQDFDVVLDVF